MRQGRDTDTGKALLRYPLRASAGGGMLTYDEAGKQYLAAVSGSVSAFFGGVRGLLAQGGRQLEDPRLTTLPPYDH
jgi:hypothetical protein